MKGARSIVLAAAVALLAPAAAAAAPAPDVHAHRGGPLLTTNGKQKPILPEETMATFRHAAALGVTLELDVKLTSNGVPVVIHDATLDRTTNCEGNVADITARKLRKECEVDLLGTEGNERKMKPKDDRRAPVPTLKKVLKLAKKKHAPVNLEIKNIPTEPDYDVADPTAYPERVAAEIRKSKYPVGKLIVQSFWALNLDVIEEDPYFEAADTSLLSIGVVNDAAADSAAEAGYDYVSPQWPVSKSYVDDAHADGLLVAPYTFDKAKDLRGAVAAGVDAVITNDPVLARRVVCEGSNSRVCKPKPQRAGR